MCFEIMALSASFPHARIIGVSLYNQQILIYLSCYIILPYKNTGNFDNKSKNQEYNQTECPRRQSSLQ